MNLSNAVSTIALKTFPLFNGLGDDRLAAIAQHALMRRVARGQAVVHAGDRTDYVYFVLTGTLKVLVSDEDGREVILTMLGQGELFGEMGVFDEQPRSASVVAVSPVDLVVIAKSDFRRMMQENFDIAWRIMSNLAERLRTADRKIESLALMDVYGRVARLLLEMAEDVEGERIVQRKISKQDIAKMIGASREMVSRVMKDLGLRGLIEESDRGIILCERILDL
ncbi:MAG: cyclic nucleotide-binding domain-containing protein [Rhodocyclaceae bacterium]|nr:cyclic nucleotide-binding domain-containing protein [Rhodocyclaceae bacterium]